MCAYCHKFTQKDYWLKTGYDVNIGYEGDVFIDFCNNLIVHIEHDAESEAIEASIPIKYCPWCGAELKNPVLKYTNQDTVQEVLQLAT